MQPTIQSDLPVRARQADAVADTDADIAPTLPSPRLPLELIFRIYKSLLTGPWEAERKIKMSDLRVCHAIWEESKKLLCARGKTALTIRINHKPPRKITVGLWIMPHLTSITLTIALGCLAQVRHVRHFERFLAELRTHCTSLHELEVSFYVQQISDTSERNVGRGNGNTVHWASLASEGFVLASLVDAVATLLPASVKNRRLRLVGAPWGTDSNQSPSAAKLVEIKKIVRALWSCRGEWLEIKEPEHGWEDLA